MSMRMGGDDAAAYEQNPLWAQLLAAWQAEEACPELLPWKAALVDELTDALEQQEENIEAAMAQESAGVRENLFSAPLYQAETARVRYGLTAYVRARTVKLLSCAGHIVADDEAWGRLSSSEQRFCRRYLALCARNHRDALLRDLPEPFADRDGDAVDDDDNNDETHGCPLPLGRAISRPPPVDDYVFARVLTDLGEVVLEDDANHTAYLAKDDVHILQYAAVRPLVLEGHLDVF